MKTIVTMLACVAGCMVILIGCSKDSTVTAPAPLTDQQVVQTQAATVDSVAQFSSSDETTIDDNGLQDPDYSGLAKEMLVAIRQNVDFNIDSLSPVRWGRHITWEGIVRDYHVVMAGDSEAIVTITKTIPGEFWVGFGVRYTDSVVIDTIVKKPFTETVTRNVRFRKIANDADREKDWVPVAITLVRGATPAKSFSIASFELNDVTQHYDTTVTDPLNTWFRLGLFRGSIPRLAVGDSVIVRVTIQSSDDSAEVVCFRHGVAGGGLLRNRVKMALVSTSGTSGNYTRVYEKRFSPHLPPDLLAVRFNAVVDAFSWGSINSPVQPFANEFWGYPYIIIQ